MLILKNTRDLKANKKVIELHQNVRHSSTTVKPIIRDGQGPPPPKFRDDLSCNTTMDTPIVFPILTRLQRPSCPLRSRTACKFPENIVQNLKKRSMSELMLKKSELAMTFTGCQDPI